MSRPYVSHCKHGHDMADAYWTTTRDGQRKRQCRTCQQDRARARATHCKRGHEYTEDSTIITETGRRRCRICRNGIKRAKKTHCRQGHPLDSDNIFIDKRGWRRCLTCKRSSARDSRSRHAIRHVVDIIEPIAYVPPSERSPLCAGRDEFTADDKATLRAASAACRRCPFVPECASRGLTEYPWGVYAGLVLTGSVNQRQRKALQHMANQTKEAA